MLWRRSNKLKPTEGTASLNEDADSKDLLGSEKSCDALSRKKESINPIERKVFYSGDAYNISWTGETIDEFEFTDLTPQQRALGPDCSFSHSFKVRGSNYPKESKVDAGPGVGKFLFLEMFENPEGCDHLSHVATIGKVQRRLQILETLLDKPFIFIKSIQVPGNPPVQFVTFHALPTDMARLLRLQDESRLSGRILSDALSREEPLDDGPSDRTNFVKLAAKFFDIPRNEKERYALWGLDYPSTEEGSEDLTQQGIDKTNRINLAVAAFESGKASFNKKHAGLIKGDITFASPYEPGALPLDSFQNKRFKLIPCMADGPWVVKMAVRSKPVILGQKVAQLYFRGANYVEVDVFVGSSSVAANIIGLCRGYAKAFICNLAIVIQGESEEELPERILSCSSVANVNFDLRSQYFPK